MIKIAVLLFAMSATSALAGDLDQMFEEANREIKDKYARDMRRLDEDARADRDYYQRERLWNEQNSALRGIESQLWMQNANRP